MAVVNGKDVLSHIHVPLKTREVLQGIERGEEPPFQELVCGMRHNNKGERFQVGTMRAGVLERSRSIMEEIFASLMQAARHDKNPHHLLLHSVLSLTKQLHATYPTLGAAEGKAVSAALDTLLPTQAIQKPCELALTKFSIALTKMYVELFTEAHAGQDEKVLHAVRDALHAYESFLQTREESDAVAQLFKDTNIAQKLLTIRRLQAFNKSVVGFSTLTADGLIRDRIYHQDADVFAANGMKAGKDPHLCEVVIVGGGPAGLSAAVQLGHLGVDAVLCEGSYVGVSMSDGPARSVHVMRTTPKESSLGGGKEICAASSAEDKLQMDNYVQDGGRAIAEQARTWCADAEGWELPQDLPAQGDLTSPAARGEIFGFFQKLADEAVAQGVDILEQTPITSARRCDDGTIELSSPNGFCIRTKKLIVATGSCGANGEFSKDWQSPLSLQDTNPMVLTLRSGHDLTRCAGGVSEVLGALQADSPKIVRQILIHESVTGHDDATQIIRSLPEGSRVAVAGSGESAIKAALEVLRSNPVAKVDLFVKHALMPWQGTNPDTLHAGPQQVRAVFDRKYARQTLQLLRDSFKTPVTPATFEELMNAVQESRARIFELGENFSADTLHFVPEVDAQGNVVTHISVKENSGKVTTALQRQKQEYGVLGCSLDWLDGEIHNGQRRLSTLRGPLIIAAGYDRSKRRTDPLMQSLEQGGFLQRQPGSQEYEVDAPSGGILSSRDGNVAVIGTANVLGKEGTGFYGGGVRASLVSAWFASQLGYAQASPIKDFPTRLMQWEMQDRQILRSTPEDPRDCPPEILFRGSPNLIPLAEEEQNGTPLTQAQKFMLGRARSLAEETYRQARALMKKELGMPEGGESQIPVLVREPRGRKLSGVR